MDFDSGGRTLDAEDFMRAAVASAEDLDHRIVVVEPGMALSPEVVAQLEAGGYGLYCSPAPRKQDRPRSFYFTRERPPAPGM